VMGPPADHVCEQSTYYPGVNTVNSSCVPTVPTGAMLWNNLNGTEKTFYKTMHRSYQRSSKKSK
jgi:hypothetical protein